MNTQKLIKVCLSLSVMAAMLGPSLALAVTTGSVSTGLTQDTTGGATPIVKVKWEANVDGWSDASTADGAQFMPSGQKNVNTEVKICTIVTDPDGLADIKNVYADVFYPTDVALGGSHVPLEDQTGAGCGQLMQEDSLHQLSKQDGINLFCNLVRNNNNNLPTFNNGYNYSEICKQDGELQKETAAVFCGVKDLSYEDPSGNYPVWAVAQDHVGLQGKLANQLTYLPVTAFEADFTNINYGNVRLNTHKIINGDLTWNSPVNTGLASVRNVGNTRLAMHVLQDDMGLGRTDGHWNVKYDARVSSDAPFSVYDPFDTTVVLSNPLDLSELNEMDFSIDISKFPPTHQSSSYVGNMTLTASPVAHLTCEQ